MADLQLKTGAGGLPAAPNALADADLAIIGQTGGTAVTGYSYRTTLGALKTFFGLSFVSKTGDTMTGTLTISQALAGGSLIAVTSNSDAIPAVFRADTVQTGSGAGVNTQYNVPIASDAVNVGVHRFQCLNSAAVMTTFGRIQWTASSKTSAAETGVVKVDLRRAGTFTTELTLGGGTLIGSATGGVQGAGTLNATTLYEAGVTLSAKYLAKAGDTSTGAQNIVNSTGGSGATLQRIELIDPGAFGPTIDYVLTTSSPAANDAAATMRFRTDDSGGTEKNVAFIVARVVDPAVATFSGKLQFGTNLSNIFTPDRLVIQAGCYLGLATGGDQGAGTLNAVGLYENGVSIASKYVDVTGDVMTGGLQVNTTGVAVTIAASTAHHVVGTSTTTRTLLFDIYGNNPAIIMRRANNTISAPATLAFDDNVGNIVWGGYDGVAFASTVNFTALASEAWTPTAHGMRLSFSTTANGSTALVRQFYLGQGLYGAALTDQGAATVNGAALYANNVKVASALGHVFTTPLTLAGHGSAATAGKGARGFITDGSTTLILGLGLTAAGGGANNVPIYSDGTNWIIG